MKVTVEQCGTRFAADAMLRHNPEYDYTYAEIRRGFLVVATCSESGYRKLDNGGKLTLGAGDITVEKYA